MTDMTEEARLQYRIAKAFAESVVGDGSEVMIHTAVQVDYLAELLEGLDHPVAQSIKLQLDLVREGRPKGIVPAQRGEVVSLRALG